jgi:hypothetical protein
VSRSSRAVLPTGRAQRTSSQPRRRVCTDSRASISYSSGHPIPRFEGNRAGRRRRATGPRIALTLAALHGLEGVLWASAYWGLGALDSPTDASVYALATMTTFEIPGLTLPPRFQMLSALEAMNRVLLFGISTAFLFAVIQAHWQSVSHRHER